MLTEFFYLRLSRKFVTNDDDYDYHDDDRRFVKRIPQNAVTALRVLVPCEKVYSFTGHLGSRGRAVDCGDGQTKDSRPLDWQRRKPDVQTYRTDVAVRSTDGQ